MDVRALLLVTAAAALLAACAASSSAVPGTRSAQPAQDLHLDLTRSSGEKIAGSGAERLITLFADGGRTSIPLSDVRAISWNEDRETVTVRTANGTLRRGVLETESLEILVPGASAPSTIRTADVRSLLVTPRIRVAGSGDAWWDVSSVNARGFDVVNPGGRLTVENIDPEAFNAGNGGAWSTVRLARDVAPLRDFALDAAIDWDADGAGPRAMQDLYVTLFDDAGGEVVCVGHHDAWDQTTGSRYTRLGGRARESGYGTQPAEGRADLRIVRAAGRLQVLWNGCELRSGENRAPVARVVVQVDYYPWRGADGESVFGTATLERLEIR